MSTGTAEGKHDEFVEELENLTISRHNPIGQFIRQEKDNFSTMSEKDFQAKYEAILQQSNQFESKAEDKVVLAENRGSRPPSRDNGAKAHSKVQKENSSDTLITKDCAVKSGSGALSTSTSSAGTLDLGDSKSQNAGIYLSQIVLKFTTLSENCSETPSFIVGPRGAKIGRDPSNEISVPSDTRLAQCSHTTIEHCCEEGTFYITDCGFENSASVRIGVGGHQKQWVMDLDARFSAGNSVFQSCGEDKNGHLIISIVDGPSKGTTKVVDRQGATVGRSSDNKICVPDRELSRRHSRVEFDERIGRFVVLDVGSTNGTYMQLVGPYGGRRRLSLNDHILVGRTGFSVNRFDFGLSEEIGYRQTMEDATSIIQHLNIPGLDNILTSPQSYFAVYDGHGGPQASLYLSQNLHVNISNALGGIADGILACVCGKYGDVVPRPPTSLSSSSRAAPARCVSPSSSSRNGGGVEVGAGAARAELGTVSVGGEEGDAGPLAAADDPRNTNSRLDALVTSTLKECFLATDAHFLSSSPNPQHGSTATTALVLGDRIYCANVGDSRTMMCRNFCPVALSRDHKPSREDEAQRVRDAGGFVINSRVMGELAVSRAFGDNEFKKGIQNMIGDEADGDEELPNADAPLIIAEPEIQVTSFTRDDQFMLLACDGLFDVFSEQDVVDFVRSNMAEHGDAQECCKNLTFEAIRNRNSRDNVSVILIILNKWY